MSLGELLRTLERDADAEVRTIETAAAADVGRIDRESAVSCADRIATAKRTFADAERAAADARLAEAERGAKRQVLGARAAMLERIRGAIRGYLALDDALARRLLAAALEFATTGTLRCAPSLIDRIPPGFVVVTDPTVNGVIVDANGLQIEATLDAVLERAWPRLAAEALALVDAETS